jgi:hypothetical protein
MGTAGCTRASTAAARSSARASGPTSARRAARAARRAPRGGAPGCRDLLLRVDAQRLAIWRCARPALAARLARASLHPLQVCHVLHVEGGAAAAPRRGARHRVRRRQAAHEGGRGGRQAQVGAGPGLGPSCARPGARLRVAGDCGARQMRVLGLQEPSGPRRLKQPSHLHRARQENKQKAVQHLQAGNLSAAYECYQRAVDVTPAMAKHLIEVRAGPGSPQGSPLAPHRAAQLSAALPLAPPQVLKGAAVQFIVAPYEADAQMAYLARRGDVHAVITEDSDLLVYGCPRVRRGGPAGAVGRRATSAAAERLVVPRRHGLLPLPPPSSVAGEPLSGARLGRPCPCHRCSSRWTRRAPASRCCWRTCRMRAASAWQASRRTCSCRCGQ